MERVFYLVILLGCPAQTGEGSEPSGRAAKPSPTATVSSPAKAQARLLDQGKYYQIHQPFSFRGQPLRAQLSIEKAVLAQAIDAYGIPKAQESFPDPLPASVLLERQSVAQKRGIDIFQRGDEVFIRPDFLLLTRRAGAELSHVHRQLVQLARPRGLEGPRALADFLVSFVQSFALDDPPRYRRSETGEQRLVAGARTAIETLYLGRGGCDTLSLLAGSLLRMSGMEIIYLLGTVDGSLHMFLGASVPRRKGDLVTHVEGRDYVIYELTSRYGGGPFPAKLRDLFKNQQFEVLSFSASD